MGLHFINQLISYIKIRPSKLYKKLNQSFWFLRSSKSKPKNIHNKQNHLIHLLFTFRL